jgi:hypothetical protein
VFLKEIGKNVSGKVHEGKRFDKNKLFALKPFIGSERKRLIIYSFLGEFIVSVHTQKAHVMPVKDIT